jgi:hypothetical protein
MTQAPGCRIIHKTFVVGSKFSGAGIKGSRDMQAKKLFQPWHKIALAVILVLIAFDSPLPIVNGARAAAVWHVPNDYATIQAALDAAVSGDIILVAPGTYTENINFNGKDVALESEKGAAVTAVRSALAIGTTVTVGPKGRITGFTIANGYFSWGAGLTVSGAGTVIQANIFEDNQEVNGGTGAAISGLDSSPTIEGNIFRNNSCDDYFYTGVVSFRNASSPVIINNLIMNNTCRAINLTLYNGATPTIINNTIVGNLTGIRVTRQPRAITQIYRNNIIYQNNIGLEAIYGAETDNPIWENNLVFGNTTNYQGILDPTGTNGNVSVEPLLNIDSKPPFMLQASSPSIDAGSSSLCPAQDFRDVPRPKGASCDIGAFEYVHEFTFTQDNYPTNEASGSVLITVILNAPLGSDATVDYATSYAGGSGEAVPDEDYTSVSGTLTFQAGSQEETFSIPLLDDTIAESEETISVTLANASSAEEVYANDSASVTIVDNDWHFLFLPLCFNRYCPNFLDDFSNPDSGWYAGEDAYVRSEYLNGEFRIFTKQSGYLYMYAAPTCERLNYSVEVDAHCLGNCGNSYGIIFGLGENWNHFYVFDITTDPVYYRLMRFDASGVTMLAGPIFSPWITEGIYANHLKVVRDGSTITLFINSVKIGDWTDNAISGYTRVGIIVGASVNPNIPTTDARFDNFQVKKLTESSQGMDSSAHPATGTIMLPRPILADLGDFAIGSKFPDWP